ncbi:MAG: MltA domain-containing protein, partial [Burkholderiaceae bacterium]
MHGSFDGRARIIAAGALVLALVACSTPVPLESPSRSPLPSTPASTSSPRAAQAATPPSVAAPSAPLDASPIEREQARWLPAAWADLPGWNQDAVIHAWPALLRSCVRPAPGWAGACDGARRLGEPDEGRIRAWMQRSLQPYRVVALDGRDQGIATGYFEPLVEASRRRTSRHAVPLYAPPQGLSPDRAWHTRAEIDHLPAARAALKGREIAWVADPLDALLLQVQGSGRLALIDDRAPDGSPRVVRLAYAGHNGQPYRSVGRWLVDQRAFTLEQASWPAIKDWARANPKRVDEMLHANPR